MKKPLVFLLALLCLGGCRKGPVPEYPAEYTITEKDRTPPPLPAACKRAPVSSDRMEFSPPSQKVSFTVPAVALATADKAEMLIRKATIKLKVEDYAGARAHLGGLIHAPQALITSENEMSLGKNITNNLVIRVRNKDFDAVSDALCALARHVDVRSMTLEDVTAQFVDATIRLKSKKEVLKQYTELLKKAMKVEDIMAVEDKLREVQEEIEAKEGELNFLSDQVSYSTIYLEMYQSPVPVAEEAPGFMSRGKEALHSGWHSVENATLSFIGAWPVWICVFGAGTGLILFIRRRKRVLNK
ncbi:MAG: DUF4349 domain-containing protein [Bacteroidia bacterium]